MIVDKDRASALLAREIEADVFVMATDVDGVYLDWGTPDARRLERTTPAELRAYDFPAGSMGPKVEAACDFVERTGGMAAIGALADIEAIVEGRTGTIVQPAVGLRRRRELSRLVPRLFSDDEPATCAERRVERDVEVEDAELVRRAQLGSAAAFEALVVRHGPRLQRYLRIELRHESDAHDALQESLTAAWRGLPGLRRADRFWPWLVGIASHKAADVHRRRARSVDAESAAESHDDDLLLETREALSPSRPSTARCCCSATCSG